MDVSEEYAHPQVTSSGITGGMTLRDWFAGQVMNALVTRGSEKIGHGFYGDAAFYAYQAADAMMEARKK